MNGLKPNRWAMTLIAATGTLLGSCAFLAAKIVNPPPIDPLDVEFWDLLGTQAAVLELESLVGTGQVSNAQFAGQPYLLIFAHPTCSACETVYPHLLHASQVQGVNVLFIASGDRQAMKDKMEEYSFSFPVVFDSLLTANKPFEVNAFPTSVLVNAEGKIAKAATGDQGAVAVIYLAGGA
ncbi:MAG: TlpA disulfide reductase family protein [Gemmatimonadota bacterium]|nr:TlpA disulfide reductase family protein [Gemmatimonadota bacterium]